MAKAAPKAPETKPQAPAKPSFTRTELVANVAKATGQTKGVVEKILNAAITELSGALSRDEKITLQPFGSFLMAVRSERDGRNPRTGEKIRIPEAKVVKFRPSLILRKAVAGAEATA